MLILFPPALGKNFFTSTLTSANWCSSQGRRLTPYLHLTTPMLSRVSRYKYLGVTISSGLSWSPHTTNCCNKTRRLTRLLYRRFYQHTNSSSLLRLYRNFICIWNSHLKDEIESLENVQKFALQVCLKSWDSEYNELLRVANLPPLHKRRAQLSLCHLYKIIHNQCYFPPILSARETRMHVTFFTHPTFHMFQLLFLFLRTQCDHTVD